MISLIKQTERRFKNINKEVHQIKNKSNLNFLKITKKIMKTMINTMKIINKMSTNYRDNQTRNMIFSLKMNKNLIII